MRLTVAILVLLLLNACSYATVEATSPGAGTTVTSARAGLHIESRGLAGVVVAGMLAAAMIEDLREEKPAPTLAGFSDWFWGPRPIPLAEDRPILEHDCTKPVPLTGNLKCR